MKQWLLRPNPDGLESGCSWNDPKGVTSEVKCISYFKELSAIIVGWDDGAVEFLDYNSGQQILLLQNTRAISPIKHILLAPFAEFEDSSTDGQVSVGSLTSQFAKSATTSTLGKTKKKLPKNHSVFDLATKRSMQRLNSIKSLALKYSVICGCDDGSLVSWHIQLSSSTSKERSVQELGFLKVEAHSSPVVNVRRLPFPKSKPDVDIESISDAQIVVSCSGDGMVKAWSARQLKMLGFFCTNGQTQSRKPATISTCQVLDKSKVIIGFTSGVIELWALNLDTYGSWEAERPISMAESHTSRVTSLFVTTTSPEKSNDCLVSTSVDHCVMTWNIEDDAFTPTKTFTFANPISSSAFFSNQNDLIISHENVMQRLRIVDGKREGLLEMVINDVESVGFPSSFDTTERDQMDLYNFSSEKITSEMPEDNINTNIAQDHVSEEGPAASKNDNGIENGNGDVEPVRECETETETATDPPAALQLSLAESLESMSSLSNKGGSLQSLSQNGGNLENKGPISDRTVSGWNSNRSSTSQLEKSFQDSITISKAVKNTDSPKRGNTKVSSPDRFTKSAVSSEQFEKRKIDRRNRDKPWTNTTLTRRPVTSDRVTKKYQDMMLTKKIVVFNATGEKRTITVAVDSAAEEGAQGGTNFLNSREVPQFRKQMLDGDQSRYSYNSGESAVSTRARQQQKMALVPLKSLDQKIVPPPFQQLWKSNRIHFVQENGVEQLQALALRPLVKLVSEVLEQKLREYRSSMTRGVASDDLVPFIYSFFTNKYGGGHYLVYVAEQKLRQFFDSLYTHQEIPLCRTLGCFLQVFDDNESGLGRQAFAIFMEALRWLNDSQECQQGPLVLPENSYGGSVGDPTRQRWQVVNVDTAILCAKHVLNGSNFPTIVLDGVLQSLGMLPNSMVEVQWFLTLMMEEWRRACLLLRELQMHLFADPVGSFCKSTSEMDVVHMVMSTGRGGSYSIPAAAEPPEFQFAQQELTAKLCMHPISQTPTSLEPFGKIMVRLKRFLELFLLKDPNRVGAISAEDFDQVVLNSGNTVFNGAVLSTKEGRQEVARVRRRFQDNGDGLACYLDLWALMYIETVETGDILPLDDVFTMSNQFRPGLTEEQEKLLLLFLRCANLSALGEFLGLNSCSSGAVPPHEKKSGIAPTPFVPVKHFSQSSEIFSKSLDMSIFTPTLSSEGGDDDSDQPNHLSLVGQVNMSKTITSHANLETAEHGAEIDPAIIAVSRPPTVGRPASKQRMNAIRDINTPNRWYDTSKEERVISQPLDCPKSMVEQSSVFLSESFLGTVSAEHKPTGPVGPHTHSEKSKFDLMKYKALLQSKTVAQTNPFSAPAKRSAREKLRPKTSVNMLKKGSGTNQLNKTAPMTVSVNDSLNPHLAASIIESVVDARPHSMTDMSQSSHYLAMFDSQVFDSVNFSLEDSQATGPPPPSLTNANEVQSDSKAASPSSCILAPLPSLSHHLHTAPPPPSSFVRHHEKKEPFCPPDPGVSGRLAETVVLVLEKAHTTAILATTDTVVVPVVVPVVAKTGEEKSDVALGKTKTRPQPATKLKTKTKPPPATKLKTKTSAPPSLFATTPAVVPPPPTSPSSDPAFFAAPSSTPLSPTTTVVNVKDVVVVGGLDSSEVPPPPPPSCVLDPSSPMHFFR
jgi:hypothetical protein